MHSRSRLLATATLLCLSMTMAWGVSTDYTKSGPPEDGLSALSGTWVVVEDQVRRAKFPPKEKTKYQFNGLTLKIIVDEKEVGVFTVKVDATRKPKEIDLTGTPPGAKEKRTRLGIYEIQDDQLKICVGFGRDVRDKRPTTFEDKDSNLSITTLKKVKN
jgi:uncharacterized protein (TIGR03067 family)